jgi:RNA polymerase sigma factor for flagellar operon FliA
VVDVDAQAQTEALWQRYAAERSPALREQLIVQYAPLVKYVVGRLAINLPTILDAEDVVSYGIFGLIEAIERFDPSRGLRFETYAIPRIRGAIIDSLRSLDQVSRAVRQKARDIQRALVELEQELGRTPTEEETAARLGMSVERYQQVCVQSSVLNLSLDHLLSGDPDDQGGRSPLQGVIASAAPDPEAVVERRELVRHLAAALAKLPKNEKLVLALYYHEELTMREISKVMGISEPRVSQLHAQALLRLRGFMRQNLPADA